jgi:hypothetical protein
MQHTRLVPDPGEFFNKFEPDHKLILVLTSAFLLFQIGSHDKQSWEKCLDAYKFKNVAFF